MSVSTRNSQLIFDALKTANAAFIGPPCFRIDITLLENWFEFRRTSKNLGDPPSASRGE
jgi:hypothetical protein